MRALLLSLGAFFIMAPAADSGCVWAGKVFSDNEMNLNGRICQVCKAGKWIDQDVKCDECKPKTNPVESNRPPGPKDCTENPNPASAQKLTYTDGAREVLQGKFKVCAGGQWAEKTPVPSQICSAK